MQAILEFGQFVYQDKDNQDDAVMKSLVSLLGDLASNVSNLGPYFQQKPYVYQILEEAQRSPTPLWQKPLHGPMASSQSLSAEPSRFMCPSVRP